MKKKGKFSTIAPIIFGATMTSLGFVALGTSLTSCGGGSTPTSDRTNKISWAFKEALQTTTDTFTAEMDLEKELASGQTITGLITSMSGTSGGALLTVKSVTTSGKKATVTFKYGSAPFATGVDTFTVKFTGSTNGTTEWSNSIENMKVTYSKS